MKSNFLIFFITEPFPNNYQKISFLPLCIYLHQANHNHITQCLLPVSKFLISENQKCLLHVLFTSLILMKMKRILMKMFKSLCEALSHLTLFFCKNIFNVTICTNWNEKRFLVNQQCHLYYFSQL